MAIPLKKKASENCKYFNNVYTWLFSIKSKSKCLLKKNHVIWMEHPGLSKPWKRSLKHWNRCQRNWCSNLGISPTFVLQISALHKSRNTLLKGISQRNVLQISVCHLDRNSSLIHCRSSGGKKVITEGRTIWYSGGGMEVFKMKNFTHLMSKKKLNPPEE